MAINEQGLFLSEMAYPLAMLMRRLDHQSQVVKLEWDQHMAVLIPEDSTEYDDGRIGQGVRSRTGVEIHAFIGKVNGLLTILNQPGVREAIQALCPHNMKVD